RVVEPRELGAPALDLLAIPAQAAARALLVEADVDQRLRQLGLGDRRVALGLRVRLGHPGRARRLLRLRPLRGGRRLERALPALSRAVSRLAQRSLVLARARAAEGRGSQPGMLGDRRARRLDLAGRVALDPRGALFLCARRLER